MVFRDAHCWLLPAILVMAPSFVSAGPFCRSRRCGRPPGSSVTGVSASSSDVPAAERANFAVGFASGKLGRDGAVVVLIETHPGTYASLHQELHAAGHSVLTINLRPEATESGLESAKSILLGKNNAGEISIDRLYVVASGSSALAALKWAAHDWSWVPLPTGRQGSDVKGLVMVSPVMAIEDAKAIARHPAIKLQMSFLTIGSDAIGPTLVKHIAGGRTSTQGLGHVGIFDDSDANGALARKSIVGFIQDDVSRRTSSWQRRTIPPSP